MSNSEGPRQSGKAIRKISREKFYEAEAQLTMEAKQMIVCFHKTLTEQHAWTDEALMIEVKRMVQNAPMEFLDFPIGSEN